MILRAVALLLFKADLLMTQKGLLIRIPMAENDRLRYLSPDKINNKWIWYFLTYVHVLYEYNNVADKSGLVGTPSVQEFPIVID